MKRVEKTYQEENLRVIWIGFQDKKENIMKFMRKHDVKQGVIFDKGNVIAKQYGIRYGAGLVVIDGNGTVKKRVPKGFSEQDLEEAVSIALDINAESEQG